MRYHEIVVLVKNSGDHVGGSMNIKKTELRPKYSLIPITTGRYPLSKSGADYILRQLLRHVRFS